MIPIVSIIGRSSVGKTTILEGLIPELRRRGYRVAVAKHIPEDAALDQPGKDSWRLFQTGAEAVVLSTPAQLAVLRPVHGETNLDDLLATLGADCDLFIVEGFKSAHVPKIEVRRGDPTRLSPLAELAAVVSDSPVAEPVPLFKFNEIVALADFVARTYLFPQPEDVTLFVDGKSVPLDPAQTRVIARTLSGIASGLKGVQKVSRLQVWARLAE